MKRQQKLGWAAACLLSLGVVGCETLGTSAQSKQVQGGMLGGLLGAASGAIIGNQTGHAGAGTAIGAGLGALAGAMAGNAVDERSHVYSDGGLVVAEVPVKFCPVGGEGFDATVGYCPNHGVELRHRVE